MPPEPSLLHWSALEFVLLALAGLAAGFVNAMAGGGSFLTLPVLLLLGLPADVANGTNRLGTFLQSLSGALTFARHGQLDADDARAVLLPSALGALGGAALASVTPPSVLKPALLVALVALALAVTLRPAAFEAPPEGTARPAASRTRVFALLFATGLYGGFAQAGVGFLLLGALAGVLGHDLVRANALKMASLAVVNGAALLVFLFAGQFDWQGALVLGLTMVVGTQLGIRFTLRAPPAVLRWVLLVTIIACALAAFLK